jgi:hypothetical protein
LDLIKRNLEAGEENCTMSSSMILSKQLGDESNEDEMHGACGMHGGLKNIYKSHLQDLGIDGRIKLKWIFKQ